MGDTNIDEANIERVLMAARKYGSDPGNQIILILKRIRALGLKATIRSYFNAFN